MDNKQAHRRYFQIFTPAMIAFLALSLLIGATEDFFSIPAPLAIILAFMATLCLVAVLWAHWRFVFEIDEYLRSIQIKGILVGLTVILVIATIWGYFEQYLDVPRLSIFYLNPIYWVSYALGTAIWTYKAGDHSDAE